jgi:sugar (pentulose or hexulose) kinase
MLLGLDLGTTNVKALIADRNGSPLGQGSCPVRLIPSGNGGVEQDIEEIWRATIMALKMAVEAAGHPDVEAIGVSTQGGAMQVLDRSGAPVGPVISWLDQRGRPFDDEFTAKLGREWFLEHIAHGRSYICVGQILRLQKEQPSIMGPQARIGFVGDIIVSRLCGQPAHDGTSAGLTLLYNPVLRAYDPDLLKRLELEARQLSPLLPPTQKAGGLLAEVAAATGLRVGTPVSPAIHDQYASALGTGAARSGVLMAGTGTAWVLLAVTDVLPKPVNDDSLLCHHAIDGLWGQILSMVNGGSAVTWALKLTGLSQNGGIDGHLESAAPGSDGVVFWPFLTPFGATGLARGTRGRLTGLQLHHGGTQILRAVVEGLACELKRHLDFLTSAGQAFYSIVLGGGAAKSQVTPQIISDFTGLPLRCFAGTEASLSGAVVLARSLLEPGASLRDLAEAMLPPAKSIEPGPNASYYQEHYRQYAGSLPRPPIPTP